MRIVDVFGFIAHLRCDSLEDGPDGAEPGRRGLIETSPELICPAAVNSDALIVMNHTLTHREPGVFSLLSANPP